MNEIDWIIIGILGISGFISLLRGFVKEAISLFIWVIALILAISLAPKLALILSQWLSHPALQMIIAFVLIFIGTLIVGGLVNQIIYALLKKAGLGYLDRLLGVVFGVLRGSIIVIACLIIVPSVIAVEEHQLWKDSQLIPKFLLLEDWAKATFSDVARWRFDMINGAMNSTSSESGN